MLNTPKIRVAPSCASSPGSTPVGTGLPIRRHSNVERRGSTINLSPPSVIHTITTHKHTYTHTHMRAYTYTHTRARATLFFFFFMLYSTIAI
jgi:hypothetical protein